MYSKIILLSLLVFSVLGLQEDKSQPSSGNEDPLKLSEIVKSLIETPRETPTDSPTEKSESDPSLATTEAPPDLTKPVPKVDNNEVPKEEPKQSKKDDLNVKKEGERIEREEEGEGKPVTPESPKEEMTPSSVTPAPLPTLTPSTPKPKAASVPPIILPTVPANRPVYPTQPEYPNNNIPNYWQTPNWGNWGRFVPVNTGNWPTQQWPTFNSWPSLPSVPSVPTIPSVASVPQIPSYTPSNYSPSRYSPFSMIPSSGVPTFSFIVPQNPQYPSGRGYPSAFPGRQPSVPTYSGFQPSYQPPNQTPYQPRFIPSVNPNQGLYPGVGGRTPGYPNVGRQPPNYYPGTEPQEPRYYPGERGQQQPPARPGSDPKFPMGPMGPEFMDESDVAMIDPSQRGNNGAQGIRIYPGAIRRIYNYI